MPLIPYPNVPIFAGVPLIPRLTPDHPNIALGAPVPLGVVPAGEPVWGILDPAGNPIYAPAEGGTLSVLSFGFERSMNVSDFPVEAVANSTNGSGFASYNKVYQPANPILTMALSGTESEKTAFLAAVDLACQTTQLYNVATPDAIYSAPGGAYTVSQYRYRRSAVQGATMLMVEISLVQVFQVNSFLTNVPAPQSPSAASPVNGGTVTGSTTTISPHFSQILQGILHGGAQ